MTYQKHRLEFDHFPKLTLTLDELRQPHLFRIDVLERKGCVYGRGCHHRISPLETATTLMRCQSDIPVLFQRRDLDEELSLPVWIENVAKKDPDLQSLDALLWTASLYIVGERQSSFAYRYLAATTRSGEGHNGRIYEHIGRIALPFTPDVKPLIEHLKDSPDLPYNQVDGRQDRWKGTLNCAFTVALAYVCRHLLYTIRSSAPRKKMGARR